MARTRLFDGLHLPECQPISADWIRQAHSRSLPLNVAFLRDLESVPFPFQPLSYGVPASSYLFNFLGSKSQLSPPPPQKKGLGWHKVGARGKCCGGKLAYITRFFWLIGGLLLYDFIAYIRGPQPWQLIYSFILWLWATQSLVLRWGAIQMF